MFMLRDHQGKKFNSAKFLNGMETSPILFAHDGSHELDNNNPA